MLFQSAVAIVALLVLPSVLFAHTDLLRDQIHRDLMNDPRTASLSESEIESLIEALVLRAEEDSTASAYLESQNTLDYSTQFAISNENANTAAASPLMIALLFLAAVLGAVALFTIRHRGKHFDNPSDISA